MNPLSASAPDSARPSDRMRAVIARAQADGRSPEAAIHLELLLRQLERNLPPMKEAHACQQVKAIMAALPAEAPRRRRGIQSAAEAIARWLGAP